MVHTPRDTDRTEELLLLVFALGAIAGSFILHPNTDGSLCLPIPVLEIRVPLPETCMSRKVLGISCPGCGLTRSFVAMARADLATAFRWNPMGPLLFIVVLFQIPYRAIEYFGLWRSHPRWMRMKDWLSIMVWPICGGFIIIWVIRMT